MSGSRAHRLDNTLPLALKGFAWLPDLRRRAGRDAVRTRLLGLPALALCGPEAARFFYDEANVRRHGAIPGPVRSTLFGHGAVHTLDGAAHRVRKSLFLALMTTDGIAALTGHVTDAWDRVAAGWPAADRVVLFDEASRIITRGVCRWTGVPLADAEVADLAADLTALVDGFATAGPRHWRARRARARREAWLAGLVGDVRAGRVAAPAGSALDVVARHRDADGQPLDPRVAAVELLNVVRPTVAVSWFVAYTAHALHRWPAHRDRLRAGDRAWTEAFAHEVRRFYPFAPFVGGRAVRELTFGGEQVPAGAMVLLDLYGQNHDARLWDDPYRFDPGRFVGREGGAYDLVPQGGGDPRTGHRCPGEGITTALLEALAVRLARLAYRVPEQDLTIPLHRVPTLPKSRFLIADVHAG
jgi:fatty-acid peroxygenase